MTRPKPTAFLWRTVVAVAAIVDYFLFSSGNFSLTYSVLGGWFPVTLLVALVVSTSYGMTALRSAAWRPYFLAHIALLAVVSIVLYSFSDQAVHGAVKAMDEDAQVFMHDPRDERIGAQEQTRALMTAIGSQEYSASREAFTPTFRRADYLLEDSRANRYRLVLTRNAIGRPEASLRRLN